MSEATTKTIKKKRTSKAKELTSAFVPDEIVREEEESARVVSGVTSNDRIRDTNYERIRGGVESIDWETIKDDPNLELVVVRIPMELKPQHLDGMTIPLPSLESHEICTFTKNDVPYEVSQVHHDSGIGAGEMKCFTCLLPHKSKLYAATKPITRHFVVHRGAPPVNEGHGVMSVDALSHKRPPERLVQPTELLKHRFFPVGSLTPGEEVGVEDASMEVDAQVSQERSQKKQKKLKRKLSDGDQNSSPSKPRSKKKHKESAT